MPEHRLHIEVLEEETGQLRDVDIESGDGVTTVGRDRGCQIVLNAPSVSRQHCKLLPGAEGWSIVDEGSTLGTSVNGQKLEQSRPQPLQHGDVIACPGYELRVHLVPTTDPTLQPDPDALGRLLRAADEESIAPARVWVFGVGDGEVAFEALPHEGMSLTVGRSGECDIQIADPFKVVSAVHAKIERNWAGVFLYDASVNGVFVNGQRVREDTKLQDGDRITIAVAEEDPDRPLLVFCEEGNVETPGGHGAYVAARNPESSSSEESSGSQSPGSQSVEPEVAAPSGKQGAAGMDERAGLSDPDVSDSLISRVRGSGGKQNGLLILILIISVLALATVLVWGVLLLR